MFPHTNYRGRLSFLPGIFAQTIKPGVPIIVEPVLYGNIFYLIND